MSKNPIYNKVVEAHGFDPLAPPKPRRRATTTKKKAG